MSEVDIPLVVGHTLGPFTLGQTLFSTVQTLLWQLPNSRVHVFNDAIPHSKMTVIAVLQQGCVYMLKFDSALQMLISVSCTLSTTERITRRIVTSSTVNATLNHDVSVEDVKALFGKPVNESGFNVTNERTVIAYKGVSFLFTLPNTSSKLTLPNTSSKLTLPNTSSKPQLTEIRVASSLDSELAKLWYPTFLAKVIPQDFSVSRLQIVVDANSSVITGVQLTHCQADQQQIQAILSFGDHLQDVISKLGCADRVYYKDSDHFSHIGSLARFQHCSADTTVSIVLNYFYLGLDAVFDSQKNTVTKIIMHTNVRDQSDYCSYSRCMFVFSISKTGVAIDRTLDETLFVCPDTNWSVIQSFVEPDCCQKLAKCHFGPSTNSNYPFHDTSLHTLSNQMIVETTWSSDIASITLLAPSTSVVNHSQRYTINQAHSLLPTREVEVEIQLSLPATKFVSDRGESIITCDDDDFHSAESSLTGLPHADVESQTESKVSSVQSLHNIYSIPVKAFYGPNVNVIVCSSETFRSTSTYDSHTRMLVYHFHDEDDLESLSKSVDNGDNSMVDYTSKSLTITSEIIDDVLSSTSTPSPDAESSPELDSFDFLSHAEILESQRATNQDAISTIEATQYLNEDGTANNDSSQPHTPHEEPPLPPEPEFRYKPKAIDTSMYSSRTTVLGEDTGLTKPSIETAGGELLIKSKATKGSSSPIIIHKRAGTNLSSKEETMKRLLRHTKSSQQRVKQKYMPTPKNVSEQTVEDDSVESDDGENNTESIEENRIENHPTCTTASEAEFTSHSTPPASAPSDESLVQVSTVVTSSPTVASSLQETPVHLRVETIDTNGQMFTASLSCLIDGTEHSSSQSINNNLSSTPVPDSSVPLSSNLGDVPVNSADLHSHSSPSPYPDESPPSHQLVESPTIKPQLEHPELSPPSNGNASDPIHTELPNTSMDTDSKDAKDSTQLTSDVPISITSDDDGLTPLPTTPRKCWEDDENGTLCPEYGPPSMTQDRVLLELIACEHEEVCTRLKERNKALSHVRQMVADPDTTVSLGELQHMSLESDAFLYDLLSGLNSREEWTLQLSAEVIADLKSWFKSDERKHLLLGSQTILKICEAHSAVLSSYVSGRVTMFTPNELSQCRSVCATLSEVAVSVGQSLNSLQQQSQDSDRELIQQLTMVRTALANLFR